MKNQKDRLNDLYTKNSLTRDDVFDSGQYKIITRSGIEKIQYNNDIEVKFKPICMTPDLIVVKAVGILPLNKKLTISDGEDFTVKEDLYKRIETFGEWNETHKKKKKNGDVVPYYSVALAEKRALSRVVLKLMGLYEYGFKGEDEEMFNLTGDDPADSAQIDYIESLLRTSTFDHDWREAVENNFGNLTKSGASKIIEELKNNQQDPIKQGTGYNQGDIKKEV